MSFRGPSTVAQIGRLMSIQKTFEISGRHRVGALTSIAGSRHEDLVELRLAHQFDHIYDFVDVMMQKRSESSGSSRHSGSLGGQ
jgi:hypothetical protein